MIMKIFGNIRNNLPFLFEIKELDAVYLCVNIKNQTKI